MLNSPYLDIAIGMIFIFLLYSILTTAILELIASVFKLRGRYLLKSITCMLEDSHLGKKLSTDFKNHPLIQKLNYTRRGSMPSYITSQTFSIVLQDILPDYFIGGVMPLTSYEKIRLLPDGDFKRALATFLKSGKLSIDEALRIWFDITMERISGSYKRMTQYSSLAIGFILAIAFNINAISIFNRLSSDKAAREQLIDEAMRYHAQKSDSLNQAYAAAKVSEDKQDKDASLEVINPSLLRSKDSLLSKTYKEQAEQIREVFEQDVQVLNNTIGIGWGSVRLKKGACVKPVLIMIAGWLITSLAVTMGAPFWFDLLQKFISIRGSGTKPKQTEKSK